MMAPLITAALNAVPRREVATASSFLNIVQRVGGAFGIALLNTFVTNSAHTHAVRMGALLPVQSTGFARLAGKAAEVSGGAVSGASAAVRTIGFRSQVMAFQNGFVFGGVLLLVGGGLLSLLLVPDTSHESHHAEAGEAPTSVRP
jgi:DHA2 family multidrug resistance protein